MKTAIDVRLNGLEFGSDVVAEKDLAEWLREIHYPMDLETLLGGVFQTPVQLEYFLGCVGAARFNQFFDSRIDGLAADAHRLKQTALALETSAQALGDQEREQLLHDARRHREQAADVEETLARTEPAALAQLSPSDRKRFGEAFGDIIDAMDSRGGDDERARLADLAPLAQCFVGGEAIRSMRERLREAIRTDRLTVLDGVTLEPKPFKAALEVANNLPSSAVDSSMLATRQQLIDAFGTFVRMDMSWFDKVGDTPKLKAARKVRGQGGRSHSEPLFCPYEVMQWLMSPNRKTSRPLADGTAWAMLEKHFPKVYAARSIGDPRH